MPHIQHEPTTPLGVREFPVKSEAVRHELIQRDFCPDCGDRLDVGWECGGCHGDFRAIAMSLPDIGKGLD